MKELIAIQQDLKAPKNQFNSFGKYKYRSCEDILEAVKPLLAKHKAVLTISDEVCEVGGVVFISAAAEFKVGDDSVVVTAQAGVDPNRKGMDIAQSFGASSSYARKYALNGLFLIDDTKDADATNTHGKSEPVKPDAKSSDIEAELRACTTEVELKEKFMSLTAAQKKEYNDLKDELKSQVMPF